MNRKTLDENAKNGLHEFNYHSFLDRIRKSDKPREELEEYQDRVKKRYRELARELHPDLVGDNEAKSERMVQATAAKNWICSLDLEDIAPLPLRQRIPNATQVSHGLNIEQPAPGVVSVGPVTIDMRGHATQPLRRKPLERNPIKVGGFQIKIL